VLAVTVDDAAQGITHIVRGADLLDNTPRQIYLQRLLGLAEPSYAHVPVLTEADGSKLAKSRRSVRLSADSPCRSWRRSFHYWGWHLRHGLPLPQSPMPGVGRSRNGASTRSQDASICL
jgi:glutamyl-Q tRNA(Asp) synthetase